MARVYSGNEAWISNDDTDHGSDYTDFGLNVWTGDKICDAIGKTRHILKDRLVANEITALYGEPKVGKTHIAIALAVACVTGGEFWGASFPRGGKVIYVSAERHEQAAQRICAHFINMGSSYIPDDFMLVGGTSNLSLSNEKLMNELKQQVKDFSPTLVIFDTYVRMTDNDEDKSRDADDNINAFKEIIRQSDVPCAGLVVHHSGKDPSKGMRGSSALLAAVTTSWSVSQRKKDKKLISLSMEAANDFEPQSPCYFQWLIVDMPRLSPLEEETKVGIVISAEEQQAETDRESQILEIVSRTGKYGIEIEGLIKEALLIGLDFSDSTFRRVLTKLVQRGAITKYKLGKQIFYLHREEAHTV